MSISLAVLGSRRTLATPQMTERFMANCDNAGIMKRIIAVLIALLALCLLMPTMLGLGPVLVSSPKNMTISDSPKYLGDPNYMTLYTTPTIAAFANNSWIPGMPFNYTQGSTWNPYNIYTSGLGNQEAPGSIVGFMSDNWTSAVETVKPLLTTEDWPGYKKHVMS